MNSKLQFFAMCLVGLVVALPAGAQTRSTSGSDSTAAPVRHSTAHARVVKKPGTNSAAASSAALSTSTPSATVIQVSPSGEVSSVFAAPASSLGVNSFNNVPGLGFDFPHLAAINGGNRNFTPTQFGHGGRQGQGGFIPILFGGYPYYYDDPNADQQADTSAQPAQQQPQVIVIQQPAQVQQSADSGNDASNSPAPADESAEQPPVPDVSNFILVRRDGRILFASVFSVVGDDLQYVTPEGIRRTVAVADLDADATQQMNEAHGTSVQLHN